MKTPGAFIRRELEEATLRENFAPMWASVESRLEGALEEELPTEVRDALRRACELNEDLSPLQARIEARILALEPAELHPTVRAELRSTPELDGARLWAETMDRISGLEPARLSNSLRAALTAPEIDTNQLSQAVRTQIESLEPSELPSVVRRSLATTIAFDAATFSKAIAARVESLEAAELPPLVRQELTAPPEFDAAAMSRAISTRVESLEPSTLPNRFEEALRSAVRAPMEFVDERFLREVEKRIEALIEVDAPLDLSILAALRHDFEADGAGQVEKSAPPALRVIEGGVHPGAPPVRRRTAGWVAAISALAAGLTLALWQRPAPVSDPEPVAVAPSGTVRVEEVAFAGLVTVLDEPGVTVIWLADG